MATSGRCSSSARSRSGARFDGGGDLEAVRLEQPDQAVSQQEEVFGDDDAHGTSMTTMVGPPTGLLTAMMPSKVASRRSTPASPVPRAASAPPTPSSVTTIAQHAAGVADRDRAPPVRRSA